MSYEWILRDTNLISTHIIILSYNIYPINPYILASFKYKDDFLLIASKTGSVSLQDTLLIDGARHSKQDAIPNFLGFL